MKPSSTSLLLSTVLLAAGLLASSPSTAAAQAWPNEPAGATTLTDWGFASMGGGWNRNGGSSIISDADAPASPTSVLNFTYPAGYPGGGSPDIVYYPLSGPNEMFIGYWWKASNPFDGHMSSINKLAFTMSNSSGHLIQMMYGANAGPFTLMQALEFPGTDNSHLGNGFGDVGSTWLLFPNSGNGAVTLGQWHRIEVYFKKGTSPTSRNGTLRWWMDGQLLGNYSTVNFPTEGFVEFQFSPTWGGVTDNKETTDYFRFDHVHLSTGGTGGTTKSDTTPPAVPSGLRAN